MEILLTKMPGGVMVPADDAAAARLQKVKTGALIRCEVAQVRNPQFHRKFFALLQLGFEAFEPPMKEYKGYPVQKVFEQFREDVIIAAGYYTVTYTLAGHMRMKAKSISFARMSQEAFEQLYSNVADVLLQKVLSNYSRQDLDAVVNRILGFV